VQFGRDRYDKHRYVFAWISEPAAKVGGRIPASPEPSEGGAVCHTDSGAADHSATCVCYAAEIEKCDPHDFIDLRYF
jgi:hypothetical protein